VDNSFVSRLRKEIHTVDIHSMEEVKGLALSPPSERTFIHHKTGMPTIMQTAKIGKQETDTDTAPPKQEILPTFPQSDETPAMPKDEISQQEIADSLGVRQQKISEWVADIRARQTAGRDCLIKKLYLLGWTQQEIGGKIGLARRTISDILGAFTDLGKSAKEINDFLKQGKTMEWICNHYSIDAQFAWALRLYDDAKRAGQN
jgi:DNA-binding XRE family transcriptional regulator